MSNARVSRFRARPVPGNRLRERRLISEQLQSRHLLAADVGHEQLLSNWVPPTEELDWSDISLRLGATATTDQWQRALVPYADRLSEFDTSTPDFRIHDLRYDPSAAVTFVYLQQTLNGLDIVNAYANLAVRNSGTVVSGYSSFVDTSKLGTSVQRLAGLSPESALAALANHYGWPNISATQVTAISPTEIGRSTLIEAPAIAREAVAYDGVYVPREGGQIEPAWRLNVQPVVSNSWLDASVSQLDGSVLFVADWTSDAQYQVFAYPKESPNDGPRTRVIDPANSTTSPFGWHDTDGVAGPESVRTRGNNTVAYRDTDANNRPDFDSYVNGGASLIFAPPLDLTQEPATYAEASTVNLFYTTNRLHDVFANKGFYAEAGNFQRNNYDATRGMADDPIFAEDLDGGGFNNASMTAPPDGRFGRMQMQLFNYTTPARSSSLDNGIVAHEFAHGVTTRLTGGPNNSSGLATLQAGAMGEGWSDFFALLFTQTTSDTAQQGRGIGTYLLGQPADGLGMRTQKYSYDMSVNTLTFGDIVGQTDPHVIGEVWAATLWDLNWALIGGRDLDPNLSNAGLGFNTNLNATTGGNNVAFRTVLHALKYQPINPTFLQARDAILRADQILNAGANQETIWRVFARRGMGYSAVATRSFSSIVTEAFDIPVVGNINFVRQGLLGSGIATAQGTLANVLGVNDSQQLTFSMAANSRVSFKLTPDSNAVQLTATLRKADGTIARAAEQGPLGGAVIISSWSAGQAGDYVLDVSSSGLTRVNLEAVRNAALETQINDSSSDAEFGLNNSFRAFERGGINAVVGQVNSVSTQMVRGNDANKFVDISATGTTMFLSDDASQSIISTVGNSLFPAGNVIVSNNGFIISSFFGGLGYTNQTIASIADRRQPILLPYWDDIFDTKGSVIWEERQVGGIPTLIVQWDQRRHISTIGDGTFQVQVFGSGPVIARYAYRDVDFGSPNYNNGASATIGVVGTDSFTEFSFNRASIIADDYIDLLAIDDTDEYRFSGSAGQKVDVAFDLDGTVPEPPVVKLLDAANNVLATASARPVSSATAIGNYDLGILGFVLPATGDYSVQIVAKGRATYYLAITESMVLDTENASGIITPARPLALPDAALGYMGPADVRDLYDLNLTSGQTVRVVLTLTDSALAKPANTLRPRVNITAPSGAILATNSTFNAAGQILLSTTATQTGRHRIDLRRLAGEGEYYLRVEQLNISAASAAPAALAVPLTYNDKPMGASPWHNLAQPMDVSDDLQVTALDALLLINELNSRQISTNSGQLPTSREQAESTDMLFDTNGDGLLTALDALLVINYLNVERQSTAVSSTN